MRGRILLESDTTDFREGRKVIHASERCGWAGPEYYSMDPFHEGAETRDIERPGIHTEDIFDAMDKATRPASMGDTAMAMERQQYTVLDNVRKGLMVVVLTMLSDGKPISRP